MNLKKILNNPRKLAHYAVGFSLLGVIVQFTNILILWTTCYSMAFITGLICIIINKKSPSQNKLDLIGYMEVGFSILPLILAIILLIFVYVVKMR